MSRASGLVVLDTNCIKYLEKETARERLRRNLRATDWEVWPSYLNVLEAVKTRNTRVRARLLATISELGGGQPLLPWPHQVLRKVGEAVAADENGVYIGDRSLDWLLEDPSAVTNEDVARVTNFLEKLDRDFDELQQHARKQLKPVLEKVEASRWRSLPRFLDEQWALFRDDYILSLWEALGLAGPAPLEALRENEAWSLYLDGQGAAAYGRAVLKEPRKRVQLTDLVQLVYLGGTARRLIATEDTSFLSTANEILRFRYTRSRAVSLRSLLQ